MTESELYRALSETTGESISTLRRHGFSLVEAPVDLPPQTVDWDDLDAERVSYLPQRRPIAA